MGNDIRLIGRMLLRDFSDPQKPDSQLLVGIVKIALPEGMFEIPPKEGHLYNIIDCLGQIQFRLLGTSLMSSYGYDQNDATTYDDMWMLHGERELVTALDEFRTQELSKVSDEALRIINQQGGMRDISTEELTAELIRRELMNENI